MKKIHFLYKILPTSSEGMEIYVIDLHKLNI